VVDGVGGVLLRADVVGGAQLSIHVFRDVGVRSDVPWAFP
jgi:hypothetical protein